VNLIAGFSPQTVEETARALKRKWSFVFIDGNHNEGYPKRDAQICEKYAEEDALVLFHDLVYPAVAEGLQYFQDKGWRVKLYQTQQIMGVAWRGAVEPIEHIPDPSLFWDLPEHLLQFST